MLLLPERLGGLLKEWLMTCLVALAMLLPALAVFGMQAEISWVLLMTAVLALVASAAALIPGRIRLLAYGALLALAAYFGYRALYPALWAIISSLGQNTPVAGAVSLYGDVLLWAAALGAVLYARLLIHGDPAFSAPLLLAPVLMMWFAGARRDLWIYLPAVAALPLLFVYSRTLDVRLSQRDQAQRRQMRKSVPAAIAIALISLFITPGGRVTQPYLEKQADRLRQWINDYFFFTDAREMFSLSSQGYQPMGEKGLGGKPRISNRPVMAVQNAGRVYLRGAILNEYSGRAWRDSLSNERYGFTSFRFNGLRDTLFDAKLPAQGRLAAQEVAIRMLSPAASTLFSPQRLRQLTLSEGMVPYFNAASELFITRNLQEQDRYSMRFEPYVAGTPDTDSLARSLRGAQDPNYAAIAADYTNLPPHLLPTGPVAQLARQQISNIVDPYSQALALRDFLKREYTYTIDVPNAPTDSDFVFHFLYETRKGYCTYFASAMTVLLRSVGIPARYVEGFVAPPAQEGKPVTLTGQQAHAWTEAYFAGLGWVTFDATSSQGESRPDAPGSGPTPTPSPQSQAEAPSPPPDENQAPSTPTPTPSPTPMPTQPPAPNQSPPPGQTPGRHGNSFPWFGLLLALAVAALLIWRALASAPQRLAAKQRDHGRQLLIWWQGIVDVRHSMGQAMLPAETLRGFAQRVSPGDSALAALAEDVGALAYGGHAPQAPGLAQARTQYMLSWMRLPWYQKPALVIRRTVRNLQGVCKQALTFAKTQARAFWLRLIHRLRPPRRRHKP